MDSPFAGMEVLADREDENSSDSNNKENLHIDHAHPIDLSKYGIVIAEDAGPGCGGVIWQSADVLISYLLSQQQSLDWTGKRIVELGSGTGAVGIALAKRYLDTEGKLPFSLCLTDLNFICPIIDKNLELNGLAGHVQVMPLKWGEDIESSVFEADVLLISDCVYLESCFDPLLTTLKSLISRSSTVCLMSYKKRRKAEKQFFIKLKKHFCVEKLDIGEIVGEHYRDRLFVFAIGSSSQRR